MTIDESTKLLAKSGEQLFASGCTSSELKKVGFRERGWR